MGVANERGSIHDPRGRKVVHYALGLGNVSNNLAEGYSLWCGLVIAKEEGIRTLTVPGDSMLAIRAMKNQVNPWGSKISSPIRGIKRIIPYFNEITFYHIKRELNGEANYWAKAASSMILCSIIKNGVLSFTLIP